MNFQRVKNVRLYETIIQQVMGMIDKGELKPGDKFPSERQLIEQLGVSRSILREAFRVLESRGIVESRPGGGRYLRKISGSSFMNFTSMDLERDALLDVIEAREIIEIRVVSLATKRATKEDIEKLMALDREFHGAGTSLEEYREKDKDMAFHLALAEASHNFVLKEVVAYLLTVSKDLREKTMLDFDDWLELCRQHSDIVKAISERKEDEAVEKIKVHLRELRHYILKEKHFKDER
ncbi:GntR family transcriptional regulator, transcriptional repressor for pyruvate dehydrogenase complex [Caldanaerovirga acetigignens]|uniref:GntR family transcriptional regulator, transcriptional repressor for pyruvate dehydrogenase complex n=1 Tax=Caldanaerovirga acetigignens TaxID=447595 RepID=A0A1M7HN59_9FIRM|nr:FadR/GntR family transcriptional regulator [Caldanaerovirga acetigignens]SHM29991.1 GntR family transcriptional regulator, transcriptional repressor for pyruvate dehydrogenase complex [Caldanaerovirga acetigignens]